MSTQMDKARNALKRAFTRNINAKAKFCRHCISTKRLKEENARLDKAIRSFESRARSEMVEQALVVGVYLDNPYMAAAVKLMPEGPRAEFERALLVVNRMAGRASRGAA